RQRHELAPGQPRAPQAVQGDQGGRGVAGPAAQAAPLRNDFFKRDLCAQAGAGGLLQGVRGAQGKVLFGRHARQVGGAADAAVGARVEVQRVVQADKTENRLQQVVAIGPAPDYVQKQVELGRGRNV